MFTTPAFNTAQEVSLEALSQNSWVAKNTIKRYIEYLEAAFLIKVVHRVADDTAIGPLAETAIFSHWFHSDNTLHYARWPEGEIDIVMLDAKEPKVHWAVEVKWSDRFCEKPEELSDVVTFCKANGLSDTLVTSKTQTVTCKVGDIVIPFVPASVYCYTVGHNLIRGRKNLTLAQQLQIELPIEQTKP